MRGHNLTVFLPTARPTGRTVPPTGHLDTAELERESVWPACSTCWIEHNPEQECS